MSQLTADILAHSLDVIGEAGVDITPIFYEKFFAAYPEQKENFYQFESSSGMMVNEMLASVLALAAGEPWLTEFLQNIVIAHRSYGDIPGTAYADLLDLLVDSLADAAGPKWKEKFSLAWESQISEMKKLITQIV